MTHPFKNVLLCLCAALLLLPSVAAAQAAAPAVARPAC